MLADGDHDKDEHHPVEEVDNTKRNYQANPKWVLFSTAAAKEQEGFILNAIFTRGPQHSKNGSAVFDVL